MDSTVNQQKPYSIDSENANNRTFSDIGGSSSSSSSSSGDDSDTDDSFFGDILSEYDTERNLSEFDDSNFFPRKQKLERSGSSIALSPEVLSFLPSPLPLNFVAPDNVTQAEPVTENALVAVDVSVPSNINSQGKKRNLSEFGNSNFFLKKSKLERSDSSIALSPEYLSLLPPPLPLNFVAPENLTQAEPVSENASVAVHAAVPSNIISQGKKHNLSECDNSNFLIKKSELERSDSSIALSPKFLSFLPPPLPLNVVAPENVTQAEPVSVDAAVPSNTKSQAAPVLRTCSRQFWKAGDYEGSNAGDSSSNSVGMDHVRVHPKFLHSNATSHKWAMGAFAELLDNSLDEVCNGATYVHVNMLKNKKDGTNMLLIEDNGGGMTPDKMRQCMSLGYSSKSKMANTIGQYGNGFKTSTMRLGADVIVFSHCQGNNGKSPTRSIGMLSYSFLMGTGKQDIVVPMIDYEKTEESWNKMIRYSLDDWNRNLETILHWSPYTSEVDLIEHFNFSEDHGTRVMIYNLWEDDEGNLELDFDSDPHDIQIRGVNRDEKNIEMAKKYPNSRHLLTYRHSLRSYASILYLRLPANFRIILRDKDVEHHNIVNDMMLIKETTYRPLHLPDRLPKDLNLAATVTIGFVKDARHHIDVQGFNVYHKNRLIKPFWRVWNAAGSDGRGAIGVLEANFIEPAHDKQGFERTPVLSRLEARLVAIQKNYWCTNCQEVGYAARRPSKSKTESRTSDKDKPSSHSNQNRWDCSTSETKPVTESQTARASRAKLNFRSDTPNTPAMDRNEGPPSDLQYERDRRRSLENQLMEAQNQLQKTKQKLEEMHQEQIALIEMMQEERERRDAEEESLKNSLKEASNVINELVEMVRRLEDRGNSQAVKLKAEPRIAF